MSRVNLVLFTLFSVITLHADTTLQVSNESSTTYTIVGPDAPTPVDTYAVDALAHYLRQITGATFMVSAATDVPADTPCIFVGQSAAASQRLGVQAPLAGLDDQAHVAKTHGSDIYLYGNGTHANLWAVMAFLETQLDWRWYTVFGNPVVHTVPDVELQPYTTRTLAEPTTPAPAPVPTIHLEPFNLQRDFDIDVRELQFIFSQDFYYQNGINNGYYRRGYTVGGKRPSKHPATAFVHTSLRYIPPTPDHKLADSFPWQTKKDYFLTNPEFFALNKRGERIPNKQLCFSNQGLREALTANILRDIAYTREQGVQGPLTVMVDAEDTPGTFCHCQDCQALEQRYQSRGGPLFSYLFELCPLLAQTHPQVYVKTLAYRRSQTQHPPALPPGQMLPENLIIEFAPIEDSYFADWWTSRDPETQGTYQDLLAWGHIAHHLRAWMYPAAYGSGSRVPVASIDRATYNLRLMAYAGVTGLFLDHPMIKSRSGFSELQRYLLFELMQDIDSDTDAIITEFTNYHYGAAAPLMRQYLDELEQGRQNMQLPRGVGYASRNFDAITFPYLTTDNIHRWQGYFDQMLALTANHPRHHLNVRAERREVDFATLWKWTHLADLMPDHYQDHEPVVSRLQTTNRDLEKQLGARPLGAGTIQTFVNFILAHGKEKPLPPQFDTVDPSLIRIFMPTRYRGGVRTIMADDAPMGYAVPVDSPGGLPFDFGFHQMGPDKRPLSKVSLSKDDITPGIYTLYDIGEVVVATESWAWFGKSWQTNLKLGRLIHEPGAENRWHLYVSLKFDGPTYGGTAPEDQVLVGRIIAIDKSPNQFQPQ